MTREEHLLTHASEECMELGHRTSKALRFGLDEIQDGQVFTNRQRIIDEYNDLVAVMEMAGFSLSVIDGSKLERKIIKVNKYLKYAKECGTLDE